MPRRTHRTIRRPASSGESHFPRRRSGSGTKTAGLTQRPTMVEPKGTHKSPKARQAEQVQKGNLSRTDKTTASYTRRVPNGTPVFVHSYMKGVWERSFKEKSLKNIPESTNISNQFTALRNASPTNKIVTDVQNLTLKNNDGSVIQLAVGYHNDGSVTIMDPSGKITTKHITQESLGDRSISDIIKTDMSLNPVSIEQSLTDTRRQQQLSVLEKWVNDTNNGHLYRGLLEDAISITNTEDSQVVNNKVNTIVSALLIIKRKLETGGNEGLANWLLSITKQYNADAKRALSISDRETAHQILNDKTGELLSRVVDITAVYNNIISSDSRIMSELFADPAHTRDYIATTIAAKHHEVPMFVERLLEALDNNTTVSYELMNLRDNLVSTLDSLNLHSLAREAASINIDPSRRIDTINGLTNLMIGHYDSMRPKIDYANDKELEYGSDLYNDFTKSKEDKPVAQSRDELTGGGVSALSKISKIMPELGTAKIMSNASIENGISYNVVDIIARNASKRAQESIYQNTTDQGERSDLEKAELLAEERMTDITKGMLVDSAVSLTLERMPLLIWAAYMSGDKISPDYTHQRSRIDIARESILANKDLLTTSEQKEYLDALDWAEKARDELGDIFEGSSYLVDDYLSSGGSAIVVKLGSLTVGRQGRKFAQTVLPHLVDQYAAKIGEAFDILQNDMTQLRVSGNANRGEINAVMKRFSDSLPIGLQTKLKDNSSFNKVFELIKYAPMGGDRKALRDYSAALNMHAKYIADTAISMDNVPAVDIGQGNIAGYRSLYLNQDGYVHKKGAALDKRILEDGTEIDEGLIVLRELSNYSKDLSSYPNDSASALNKQINDIIRNHYVVSEFDRGRIISPESEKALESLKTVAENNTILLDKLVDHIKSHIDQLGESVDSNIKSAFLRNLIARTASMKTVNDINIIHSDQAVNNLSTDFGKNIEWLIDNIKIVRNSGFDDSTVKQYNKFVWNMAVTADSSTSYAKRSDNIRSLIKEVLPSDTSSLFDNVSKIEKAFNEAVSQDVGLYREVSVDADFTTLLAAQPELRLLDDGPTREAVIHQFDLEPNDIVNLLHTMLMDRASWTEHNATLSRSKRDSYDSLLLTADEIPGPNDLILMSRRHDLDVRIPYRYLPDLLKDTVDTLSEQSNISISDSNREERQRIAVRKELFGQQADNILLTSEDIATLFTQIDILRGKGYEFKQLGNLEPTKLLVELTTALYNRDQEKAELARLSLSDVLATTRTKSFKDEFRSAWIEHRAEYDRAKDYPEEATETTLSDSILLANTDSFDSILNTYKEGLSYILDHADRIRELDNKIREDVESLSDQEVDELITLMDNIYQLTYFDEASTMGQLIKHYISYEADTKSKKALNEAAAELNNAFINAKDLIEKSRIREYKESLSDLDRVHIREILDTIELPFTDDIQPLSDKLSNDKELKDWISDRTTEYLSDYNHIVELYPSAQQGSNFDKMSILSPLIDRLYNTGGSRFTNIFNNSTSIGMSFNESRVFRSDNDHVLVHPIELTKWAMRGYERDKKYDKAKDRNHYLKVLQFNGTSIHPSQNTKVSTPWDTQRNVGRVQKIHKELDKLYNILGDTDNKHEDIDVEPALEALSDAYAELDAYMSILTGPDSFDSTLLVKTADGSLEMKNGEALAENDKIYSGTTGLSTGDKRINNALSNAEYRIRQALMNAHIQVQGVLTQTNSKTLNGQMGQWSAAATGSWFSGGVQSASGSIIDQARSSLMDKYSIMKGRSNRAQDQSYKAALELNVLIKQLRRNSDRTTANEFSYLWKRPTESEEQIRGLDDTSFLNFDFSKEPEGLIHGNDHEMMNALLNIGGADFVQAAHTLLPNDHKQVIVDTVINYDNIIHFAEAELAQGLSQREVIDNIIRRASEHDTTDRIIDKETLYRSMDILGSLLSSNNYDKVAFDLVSSHTSMKSDLSNINRSIIDATDASPNYLSMSDEDSAMMSAITRHIKATLQYRQNNGLPEGSLREPALEFLLSLGMTGSEARKTIDSKLINDLSRNGSILIDRKNIIKMLTKQGLSRESANKEANNILGDRNGITPSSFLSKIYGDNMRSNMLSVEGRQALYDSTSDIATLFEAHGLSSDSLYKDILSPTILRDIEATGDFSSHDINMLRSHSLNDVSKALKDRVLSIKDKELVSRIVTKKVTQNEPDDIARRTKLLDAYALLSDIDRVGGNSELLLSNPAELQKLVQSNDKISNIEELGYLLHNFIINKTKRTTYKGSIDSVSDALHIPRKDMAALTSTISNLPFTTNILSGKNKDITRAYLEDLGVIEHQPGYADRAAMVKEMGADLGLSDVKSIVEMLDFKSPDLHLLGNLENAIKYLVDKNPYKRDGDTEANNRDPVLAKQWDDRRKDTITKLVNIYNNISDIPVSKATEDMRKLGIDPNSVKNMDFTNPAIMIDHMNLYDHALHSGMSKYISDNTFPVSSIVVENKEALVNKLSKGLLNTYSKLYEKGFTPNEIDRLLGLRMIDESLMNKISDTPVAHDEPYLQVLFDTAQQTYDYATSGTRHPYNNETLRLSGLNDMEIRWANLSDNQVDTIIDLGDKGDLTKEKLIDDYGFTTAELIQWTGDARAVERVVESTFDAMDNNLGTMLKEAGFGPEEISQVLTGGQNIDNMTMDKLDTIVSSRHMIDNIILDRIADPVLADITTDLKRSGIGDNQSNGVTTNGMSPRRILSNAVRDRMMADALPNNMEGTEKNDDGTTQLVSQSDVRTLQFTDALSSSKDLAATISDIVEKGLPSDRAPDGTNVKPLMDIDRHTFLLAISNEITRRSIEIGDMSGRDNLSKREKNKLEKFNKELEQVVEILTHLGIRSGAIEPRTTDVLQARKEGREPAPHIGNNWISFDTETLNPHRDAAMSIIDKDYGGSPIEYRLSGLWEKIGISSYESGLDGKVHFQTEYGDLRDAEGNVLLTREEVYDLTSEDGKEGILLEKVSDMQETLDYLGEVGGGIITHNGEQHDIPVLKGLGVKVPSNIISMDSINFIFDERGQRDKYRLENIAQSTLLEGKAKADHPISKIFQLIADKNVSKDEKADILKQLFKYNATDTAKTRDLFMSAQRYGTILVSDVENVRTHQVKDKTLDTSSYTSTSRGTLRERKVRLPATISEFAPDDGSDPLNRSIKLMTNLGLELRRLHRVDAGIRRYEIETYNNTVDNISNTMLLFGDNPVIRQGLKREAGQLMGDINNKILYNLYTPKQLKPTEPKNKYASRYYDESRATWQKIVRKYFELEHLGEPSKYWLDARMIDKHTLDSIESAALNVADRFNNEDQRLNIVAQTLNELSSGQLDTLQKIMGDKFATVDSIQQHIDKHPLRELIGAVSKAINSKTPDRPVTAEWILKHKDVIGHLVNRTDGIIGRRLDEHPYLRSELDDIMSGGKDHISSNMSQLFSTSRIKSIAETLTNNGNSLDKLGEASLDLLYSYATGGIDKGDLEAHLTHLVSTDKNTISMAYQLAHSLVGDAPLDIGRLSNIWGSGGDIYTIAGVMSAYGIDSAGIAAQAWDVNKGASMMKVAQGLLDIGQAIRKNPNTMRDNLQPLIKRIHNTKFAELAGREAIAKELALANSYEPSDIDVDGSIENGKIAHRDDILRINDAFLGADTIMYISGEKVDKLNDTFNLVDTRLDLTGDKIVSTATGLMDSLSSIHQDVMGGVKTRQESSGNVDKKLLALHSLGTLIKIDPTASLSDSVTAIRKKLALHDRNLRIMHESADYTILERRGIKENAQSDFFIVHNIDIGDPKYKSELNTESVYDTVQRLKAYPDQYSRREMDGTLPNLRVHDSKGKIKSSKMANKNPLLMRDFVPDEHENNLILKNIRKATSDYRTGPLEVFVTDIFKKDGEDKLTSEQAETIVALRELFGFDKISLSEVPAILKTSKMTIANIYNNIQKKIDQYGSGIYKDSGLKNAKDAYQLSFDIARDKEMQESVKNIHQLVKKIDTILMYAKTEYGYSVQDTPLYLIADSQSTVLKELLKKIDYRHIARTLLSDELVGKRATEILDQLKLIPESIEGKYTSHVGTPFEFREHAPKESFDDNSATPEIDGVALERLFSNVEKKVSKLLDSESATNDSGVRGDINKLIGMVTYTLPSMVDYGLAYIDHSYKYAQDEKPDETDQAMAINMLAMFGRRGNSIVPGSRPFDSLKKLKPDVMNESASRLNEDGEEFSLFDLYDANGGYTGEQMSDNRSSIPQPRNIYTSLSVLKKKMQGKDVFSIAQHAARIAAASPSAQADTTGSSKEANWFLSTKLASFISKQDQMDSARRIVEDLGAEHELTRPLVSVLKSMGVKVDSPISADISRIQGIVTSILREPQRRDDGELIRHIDSEMRSRGIEVSNKNNMYTLVKDAIRAGEDGDEAVAQQKMKEIRREFRKRTIDNPWNVFVDSVIKAQAAHHTGLYNRASYERTVEILASSEMRAGANREINYYRDIIAMHKDGRGSDPSKTDGVRSPLIDTPQGRKLVKWAKQKLYDLTGSTYVPSYHFNQAGGMKTPKESDHYTDSITALGKKARSWDGKSIDEKYWARKQYMRLTGIDNPMSLKGLEIQKHEEILAHNADETMLIESRAALSELTGIDYPTDYNKQYRSILEDTPKDGTNIYQFFDPYVAKSTRMKALRTITGEHLDGAVNPAEFITSMHLLGHYEGMSKELYPFNRIGRKDEELVHTIEEKMGSTFELSARMETLMKTLPALESIKTKDPLIEALSTGEQVVTGEKFEDGQWILTYDLNGDKNQSMSVSAQPQHMVYNAPDLTPKEVIANNEAWIKGKQTPYGFIPVRHMAEGLLKQPTVDRHLHTLAEQNIAQIIDNWKKKSVEHNPAMSNTNDIGSYTIILGDTAAPLDPAEATLLDFVSHRVEQPPEISVNDMVEGNTRFETYNTYVESINKAYDQFREQHKELADHLDRLGLPKKLSGEPLDRTKLTDQATQKKNERAIVKDMQSFKKALSQLNKRLKSKKKIEVGLRKELLDLVRWSSDNNTKLSLDAILGNQNAVLAYDDMRTKFDEVLASIESDYGRDAIDKVISPDSYLYAMKPDRISRSEHFNELRRVRDEKTRLISNIEQVRKVVTRFDRSKENLSTVDTLFIQMPPFSDTDQLTQAYSDAFVTQLESFVNKQNAESATSEVPSVTLKKAFNKTGNFVLDIAAMKRANNRLDRIDAILGGDYIDRVQSKGESSILAPYNGTSEPSAVQMVGSGGSIGGVGSQLARATAQRIYNTYGSESRFRDQLEQYKVNKHFLTTERDKKNGVVVSESSMSPNLDQVSVTTSYITASGHKLSDQQFGIVFNTESDSDPIMNTSYAMTDSNGDTVIHTTKIMEDLGFDTMLSGIGQIGDMDRYTGDNKIHLIVDSHADGADIELKFGDLNGAETFGFKWVMSKDQQGILQINNAQLELLNIPHNDNISGMGIKAIGDYLKTTYQEISSTNREEGIVKFDVDPSSDGSGYAWSEAGVTVHEADRLSLSNQLTKDFLHLINEYTGQTYTTIPFDLSVLAKTDPIGYAVLSKLEEANTSFEQDGFLKSYHDVFDTWKSHVDEEDVKRYAGVSHIDEVYSNMMSSKGYQGSIIIPLKGINSNRTREAFAKRYFEKTGETFDITDPKKAGETEDGRKMCS